jgi:hypothetical protein
MKTTSNAKAGQAAVGANGYPARDPFTPGARPILNKTKLFSLE